MIIIIMISLKTNKTLQTLNINHYITKIRGKINSKTKNNFTQVAKIFQQMIILQG
jgi:hypothetical protein